MISRVFEPEERLDEVMHKARKLRVEQWIDRTSLQVAGRSHVSFALLKLIPAREPVRAAIGLDLTLVLDVSGSMQENDDTGKSRLERVQNAVIEALDRLRPDDKLTLIAFGHDARVVLPATTAGQRTEIERAIRSLDQTGVDPAGASMDEGLGLALQEVARPAPTGRTNQVVLLTDGKSVRDKSCREHARLASERGMHLTLMGLGTEWNVTLLQDMARITQGRWYYIDPSQPGEISRVFHTEFRRLSRIAFTNVEMHLRPIKDVRLMRVRQAAPEITEVPLVESATAHCVARLGALDREEPTSYVLDFSLPRRLDGRYVIAQVEIQYNLVDGERESTGQLPLQVSYDSKEPGHVCCELLRRVDELQIYELNKTLQAAIAADKQAEASRAAESICLSGDLLGPRAAWKAALAGEVVQELTGTGRISKRSLLAMDNVARLAGDISGTS